MLTLKRLVRATSAALALAVATISTSANAGYVGGGFGAFFGVGPNNNGWGMNPQQNVGIPISVPWMGISPQQNVGFAPPMGWGMNNQQPPFGWGMSPQQNVGFLGAPFFGMSPQQNAGLAPPPFGWGMNPQQSMGWDYPGWDHRLGMNPQQTLAMWPNAPLYGMNPQQAVGFFPYPWLDMNPQQQGQPAQQGGAQPVQCSINTVAALTKSVDDCEKAGGDVAGAKTADAAKK